MSGSKRDERFLVRTLLIHDINKNFVYAPKHIRKKNIFKKTNNVSLSCLQNQLKKIHYTLPHSKEVMRSAERNQHQF